MSREIFIATPENVPISYELAGLASRFAAYVVDMLLKGFIILALAVAETTLISLAGTALSRFFGDALQGITTAAAIVAGFAVFIGYNIFFETIWNGQTPGKRLYDLRVIRQGGYPIDPTSAFVRNLLSIIDFFPLLNLAALFSILLSRDYQRIGDHVAGTIVIKQSKPISLSSILRASRILPENLDQSALETIRYNAGRLTPDEYQAVKHFTQRRTALPGSVQQNSARLLAEPIMQRLAIVPPDDATQVDYAIFLEYLAVAYEQLKRPLSFS